MMDHGLNGENKIKTRLIHSGIDTVKNHGSLSDPFLNLQR